MNVAGLPVPATMMVAIRPDLFPAGIERHDGPNAEMPFGPAGGAFFELIFQGLTGEQPQSGGAPAAAVLEAVTPEAEEGSASTILPSQVSGDTAPVSGESPLELTPDSAEILPPPDLPMEGASFRATGDASLIAAGPLAAADMPTAYLTAARRNSQAVGEAAVEGEMPATTPSAAERVNRAGNGPGMEVDLAVLAGSQELPGKGALTVAFPDEPPTRGGRERPDVVMRHGDNGELPAGSNITEETEPAKRAVRELFHILPAKALVPGQIADWREFVGRKTPRAPVIAHPIGAFRDVPGMKAPEIGAAPTEPRSTHITQTARLTPDTHQEISFAARIDLPGRSVEPGEQPRRLVTVLSRGETPAASDGADRATALRTTSEATIRQATFQASVEARTVRATGEARPESSEPRAAERAVGKAVEPESQLEKRPVPKDLLQAEAGKAEQRPVRSLGGSESLLAANSEVSRGVPQPSHEAARPTPLKPSGSVLPEPQQSGAAARDIRLTISSGEEQDVHVQLIERMGKIHIAVRNPGGELTSAMQRALPELVARLTSEIGTTDSWIPVKDAGVRAESNGMQNGGAGGFGSSPDGQPDDASGGQRRRQDDRHEPEWLNEFHRKADAGRDFKEEVVEWLKAFRR